MEGATPMNWDDFHSRAKGALPPEPLPPKRYWIGVLLHDRPLDQPLEQTDFVWMKGHGKIALGIIQSIYEARNPGVDFELQYKDHVFGPEVLAKRFNDYHDNIVVFRAIEKTKRVPLQPTNRQLRAEIQTPLKKPVQSPPVRHATSTLSSACQSSCASPMAPSSAIKDNAPAPAWDALLDHMYSAPTASSPSNERDLISPLTTRTVQTPTPSRMTKSGSVDMHPKVEPVDTPTCPSVYPMTRHLAQDHDVVARPVPYISPYSHPNVHASSLPASESMHRPATIHSEAIVKDERNRPPPISSMPGAVNEFDPENVFNRDGSADMEEEVTRPTDQHLRQIIHGQSPETLEAAVAQSLKVLQGFKDAFMQHKDAGDSATWIDAIDKLSSQTQQKRTVVGVVGNTGAGKSSVINAILDEERLVPTNCMRACTAVVTELSWNDSIDPSCKYRAEIEFIGRADWEKELSILLKDFLTEDGAVSRDTSNPDTDAGIAWAKFHAVYPNKTKEMLSNCNVSDLTCEKSVLDVLDTVKKIDRSDAVRFYTKLQKYVDSKEKATGKKDKPKAWQMEYWPLIKVVKIYVKSPALSTGAVIVDLPGVHDSNAARAAVAEGYLKQCTGLWIVAPITRAVDDKAAKTLLGDSFKRQLKYDGGFSAVTFICSKTDDISITEATDSLNLEDQISGLEKKEQEHEAEMEEITTKISDFKASLEVYSIAMNEADQDLEAWDELKDKLDGGEIVYAPVANKRKKGESEQKSRKRRHVDDDSDVEYVASSDEEAGGSDGHDDMDDIQAPQEPLTADEIKTKIEELRSTKKHARQEKKTITDSIKELRPGIAEIKEKIAEIRAQKSAICIAGRNEYSKGAIQQDFAAGIKELDQENAAEEDEDNFNPDVDIRDYDQVAQSLPVFCVSSRAYQKMCGRLQKDEAVPGFTTKEETEVPQLQAHCKKLTEAGRLQSCRTFLLNFSQQLNTFWLWASSDGSGVKMTDEEKHTQGRWLLRRLDELEKGLEEAVRACVSMMKAEMHNQIFDKYPELIEEAIKLSTATASGWGAPKIEGGLYWATYKAVVRREGTYRSVSAGHRDFNAELINPIIKRLANGWERTFQNRLPQAFATYIENSGKVLHAFHSKIEERARQNGVGLASLAALKSHIYNVEQLFVDLQPLLETSMNELQREANREFTPMIAQTMHHVYEICTDERGAGSFARMKRSMSEHVELNRHTMFGAATETVKSHLGRMCSQLEEKMANKADDIFAEMRKVYMSVLGGVQVKQGAVMKREERAVRAAIRSILIDVDTQFEPIANGKLEDDEKLVEDSLVEKQEDVDD